MDDLAIDVSEVLRDIHSRTPRPTWQEAVAEAVAHEYTGHNGNTFNLIDEEDDDGGAAQIESVMHDMIGHKWNEEWSDEEDAEDEDASQMDVRTMAAAWRRDLLENVVPFWEKHSLDHEYGGYFTCLDRDGSCLDTVKFM